MMIKPVILAFLIFFSSVNISFAETGWKIGDFKSVIDIQADGYVRVKETIRADFGALKRHGIFRDIPVGYLTSDGKSLAIEAKVNSVTDGTQPVPRAIPYETSNTNGNLRLKIGDANTLITGVQVYVIDYTLRGVLRSFENYDELYWNVTGDQWPIPTEHAEATFILPKDGIMQWACYFGARGSNESCGGEKTSESTVHFNAPRALQSNEGVTIAVGFTKGLVPILPPLAEDSPKAPEMSPLVVIVSFFTTLGFGVFFLTRLWWRKGRDLKTDGTRVKLFEHETIIAEYETPHGLRPGELGVIIDETADTLDITATIVDLAVRGHLTIEEIPKTWFLGSIDYKLTKTNADEKALLGYEKKLLDALFKTRAQATLSEVFHILKGGEPTANDPTHKSVEISDLKNTFYKDLTEIKEALYEETARKKLFEKNPSQVRMKYGGIGALFIVTGIVLLFAGPFFQGIFFGVGSAMIPCGIFCLILAMKAMPRRAALGHEAYLKAKGYKLFISQTETYRQQFFEKENTFMEVLPYAIVFGVTDKLADAMKDMGVNPPAPNWYHGTNAFNAAVFAGNMGDFSKSLSSAMASAPSSSGSGGGGHSGGGFGGGGGGSW
jgi:uncharacterized membrane protein YgcG